MENTTVMGGKNTWRHCNETSGRRLDQVTLKCMQCRRRNFVTSSGLHSIVTTRLSQTINGPLSRVHSMNGLYGRQAASIRNIIPTFQSPAPLGLHVDPPPPHTHTHTPVPDDADGVFVVGNIQFSAFVCVCVCVYVCTYVRGLFEKFVDWRS
jgi:hypothetical protein